MGKVSPVKLPDVAVVENLKRGNSALNRGQLLGLFSLNFAFSMAWKLANPLKVTRLAGLSSPPGFRAMKSFTNGMGVVPTVMFRFEGMTLRSRLVTVSVALSIVKL
ncbi:MAG: hypothetical protein M2R45_02602 [Verrucomicrobia subdivision 3 bacterium]|nr:hypothetical protein [Limisphaerales bacterium]MCS1416430.1 hypothetical protein [Limisphaerales bacterium]